MSDDEEVILRTSELHRYLSGSNIDGITCGNGNESNYSSAYETGPINHIIKPFEDIKLNNFYEKPELSWHTSYMIDTILKTGLMYTDHVADIELYLNPSYIRCKHNFFKTTSIFYSTFLLSSAVSVAVLCKKMRALHFISIFAGSVYGMYKVYDNFLFFYARKRVKRFANAIERLFSITKQALSFIFESEFLLKTKMVKEQLVYLPDGSWIHSNTPDGLKYSGLILPEFRNILGEVFLNVIINFDNLSKYTRMSINLLPYLDCDSNCIQLPDVSTLQEISIDPSGEDLKKLNSMYLIGQSEFLKRLTLSFVKDFWLKRDSDNLLKSIVGKLSISASAFMQYADTLESYYESCLKINKNRSVQIERNKVLKAKNAKEKLLLFVKNLLTKADVHMFSLSVDLKMLESWIEECERDKVNNVGDGKKILVLLQNRLRAMKSNTELFNNLFIDNYNILKNIVNDETFNDVTSNSIIKFDKNSDECVQKTGIEVGKSDFNCPGEDEVLISLCNPTVSNNDDKSINNDYEDEEIQRCLPKNVLLELKCALKGKKDEWIEREKKALKSDITMDKLDFDTLSNTSASYKDASVCKNNPYKNFYHSKVNENYESESTSGEEDSYVPSKKIMTNSFCDLDESTLLITKPYIDDLTGNDHQSDNDSKCSNDSIDNSAATTITSTKNTSGIFSLMDQIKSAQKSFNLNLKEEEFIDDSDD